MSKIEIKGLLKDLVKPLEFEVLRAEDESSEENEVLKVTIAENITATGSIDNPDGTQKKWTSDVIYVGKEDIETFNAGLVKDGKKIFYRGNLKFDVSRPKGQMVNGEFKISQSARIWLTGVSFKQKGRSMRTQNREAAQQAINNLFAGKSPVAATTPVAPEAKGEVKPTVTVETETGG